MIVAVPGVITAYASLYFGKLEIGWGYDNLWGGIALFIFTYFLGVLIFGMKKEGRTPPR